MKLTIGMATYDDYDGVYFTIQALRTYHPEVILDCEIIVVDNHPGTKTSEALQNLCTRWSKGTGGMRYIPMVEPIGTTQPRNRIFQEASGDAVLCIDGHVLLAPGSLAKLFDYYEHNPHSKDILSGPILYDDFSVCGDHFADFWRGEMWGIWGKAWSCPCSATHFTVLNTNDRCDYRLCAMGLLPIMRCLSCHKELPDQPYPRHEEHLTYAGFNQLSNGTEPYAIPGMGLGLFSCWNDAWPGFNPHFRGFGGEELYIHEKFRQAGGQALCLPWLKWGHRFGRPNGTPYLEVCTRFNKVRNYILGLQEIGHSLVPCYEHFVKTSLVPHGQWAWICNDPINHNHIPLAPGGRIERGSNTIHQLQGS